MNAFLLECLYPTGWRRMSELHWRYADASDAASKLIATKTVRSVRVLAATIQADAVCTLERVPTSSCDSQGGNNA